MDKGTAAKSGSLIGRLRRRWNVSGWGILAILLSFSLAGMTVVRVARPLLNRMLPPETPFGLKFIGWLVFILPAYQIFLLLFGTLLGQFRFFWERDKKIVKWLARLFASGTASSRR